MAEQTSAIAYKNKRAGYHLPFLEKQSRRYLRLARDGFLQFLLELFFGPLAGHIPLALENFSGPRNLFSNPGQPGRDFFTSSGQCKVLSAQLSSAELGSV